MLLILGVPGKNAPYQTVQAGINAANLAGGGTVAIRKGTYVENITLQPNVDLVGFSGINPSPDTVISGTVTASYTGNATITNMGFSENVGSPIQIGGAGSMNLYMVNCVVNTVNTPIITQNNASSGIGHIELSFATKRCQSPLRYYSGPDNFPL